MTQATTIYRSTGLCSLSGAVQMKVSHGTESYEPLISSILSRDWLQTGFGLVIGFTEHLQNVTMNNYDSLTELHIPKITVTTAHIKSSQSSLAVVWQRLQRLTFPFLWVPKLSPASATSFSLLTTETLKWLNKKSESKLCYDRQSVSLSWCRGLIWGPRPNFLLSDSCGFLDVGHPLWREDGPVVYNCCWSSSAQSFSGPRPAELIAIFYCLTFEITPAWRAKSPYLYPPGTG
jgi:hypothetical protein